MPQCVALAAVQSDYENFPAISSVAEDDAGIAVIAQVLKRDRNLWGPLEHPSMTLSIRADHNTIESLRNNNCGLRMDVQSLRRLHSAIMQVATGALHPEDVFYVRPPGCTYRDGLGKTYHWTVEQYEHQLAESRCSALDYLNKIEEDKVSGEHAAAVLISSYLQNAVVTGSLRDWLDTLELNFNSRSSYEVLTIMEMIALQVQKWAPEVYEHWDSYCRRPPLMSI